MLAGAGAVLPPILDDVRARLAIVRDWMAGQSTFEWVEPAGGVVGLVRFRPEVEVDTDRFYDVLLADHGTYVGPGHWFEVDDRHFRLGFGWPTHDELRAGLAGLWRRPRLARDAPQQAEPAPSPPDRPGACGSAAPRPAPLSRHGKLGRGLHRSAAVRLGLAGGERVAVDLRVSEQEGGHLRLGRPTRAPAASSTCQRRPGRSAASAAVRVAILAGSRLSSRSTAPTHASMKAMAALEPRWRGLEDEAELDLRHRGRRRRRGRRG